MITEDFNTEQGEIIERMDDLTPDTDFHDPDGNDEDFWGF